MKSIEMKIELGETDASTSSDQRNDEQLEAFTQTDAFTLCKELTPQKKEKKESTVSTCQILDMDQSLRRKRQRIKTPDTVLKLMEKHRESERLRHHSLNRQLHLICEKVPGFIIDGKETKVVMMQRIISYIAYLENSVKIICTKLDMKCDSLCFLTSRIRRMKWSDPEKREFHQFPSEDSRDSGVSSLSMSRLLKLSSPSIDSTIENASRDSALTFDSQVACEKSEEDHTDSYVNESSPVQIKIPDIEWPAKEEEVALDQGNAHFYPLLEVSADDPAVFEVPTSSFEVGLMETGEVKWLGSPDKCSFYGAPKIRKNDLNFGIKFDPELLDESGNEFSHSDIVSPDQVLPQLSIKQEIVEDSGDYQNIYTDNHHQQPTVNNTEDETDIQVVPQSFNRRKQSSPRKNSHCDLKLNELPIEFTDYMCNVDGSLSFTPSIENTMVGSFMEVESSTPLENCNQDSRPTFDLTQELAHVREKVLFAARHESASKQDLRRSSWLNGFMMYSCIHRKYFISDNPGMHTAQISKLVGQVWRDMTEEQKSPYREQARLCSQELQHILDEKNRV